MAAAKRSALVLLHGFPMDGRLWDRVVPHLDSRFQILVPDLPGFGDSAPLSGPFSMPAVADWLAHLLSESAVAEPVTLCGLSMGGYIALEFAARHGGQVARLVLCDSKTQEDSGEARHQRLAMSSRMREPIGQELLPEIADGMLVKLLAPATIESAPEVVRTLRAMILACSPSAIAAAQEGMAARRDTADVIRNAEFPVLCVAGEFDSLTPPGLMREIAESAPRGSFQMIAGAGHCSPMENPAAFSAGLLQFCDNHLA